MAIAQLLISTALMFTGQARGYPASDRQRDLDRLGVSLEVARTRAYKWCQSHAMDDRRYWLSGELLARSEVGIFPLGKSTPIFYCGYCPAYGILARFDLKGGQCVRAWTARIKWAAKPHVAGGTLSRFFSPFYLDKRAFTWKQAGRDLSIRMPMAAYIDFPGYPVPRDEVRIIDEAANQFADEFAPPGTFERVNTRDGFTSDYRLKTLPAELYLLETQGGT